MRSTFFSAGLIFLAALFLPHFAIAEDGQENINQSEKPMQGHVLMMDSGKKGTLPRLMRPPSPAVTAPPTDQSVTKGESEALKARVMEAAGLKSLFPKDSKGTAYDAFALSARELNQLSKYDISVLIDSSGSMALKDCTSIHSFITPERISRWEWCQEQTTMLSEQIAGAFPTGITVVPFASHADRYANVHPSTITQIFKKSFPRGSTRLDEALGIELANFMAERDRGMRKKPLLIAVITDGVPSRPHTVLQGLAAITHKLNQQEIRIVFFLIGDAPIGSAFSMYVCNLKKIAGASFEIASCRSFRELCEIGLAKSLARSVELLP